MKKNFILLLSLCAMLIVQTSCNKDDDNANSTTTPTENNSNGNSNSSTDTAVVINGVTWATRNVAAPGKFANNPENAGMFYQWNSKVGWPSTGYVSEVTATNGATTWNSSWTGGYSTLSASDTWTSNNDPSPSGWRVPTYVEICTLLDTSKVTSIWVAQNMVYGRKFTEKITRKSLFIPAVGWRSDISGTINGLRGGQVPNGNYWSTTTESHSINGVMTTAGNIISMHFDSDYALSTHSMSMLRADGLSIRSVKK